VSSRGFRKELGPFLLVFLIPITPAIPFYPHAILPIFRTSLTDTPSLSLLSLPPN
jgi:hypothetical protein